jgi:hypothetical protein
MLKAGSGHCRWGVPFRGWGGGGELTPRGGGSLLAGLWWEWQHLEADG